MRVLVFGDSIGHGLWDTQGGWVERLRKRYCLQLIEDLSGDEPIIFNLSIPGDDSTEVIKRFDAEVENRRWPGQELVIIFAVGTNDTWILADGSFKTDREAFKLRMQSLASSAKRVTTANRMIFVGLPACDESRAQPVSWVDLSFTNQRIQSFETAISEVAAQEKCAFVGLSAAFLERQPKTGLLSDGLHPNDAGHELIAELVSPALADCLRD